MKACNFEKLLLFLDKQLTLDEKLEVLSHLDECEICRDTIYHISRDRDSNLFIARPQDAEKAVAG
jgi:hypothetical protein